MPWSPAGAADPDQAGAGLVLRDATILTEHGAVTGQEIRVRDGRISRIGPTGPDTEDGAPVLSLPGRWIVPGLVDSHVHLGSSGRPGRDEAEATDPERARGRLADQLDHGVTAVADLFGHPPAMAARRQAVASGSWRGPRILAAGQGLTNPDGHPVGTAYQWTRLLRDSAALQVDDPETARAHVRWLARSWRADVVKVVCSGANGVPRLSPPVLSAIAEEAHEHGLRVLAHVHTDEDALAAIPCQVDAIEHIPVGPRLAEALAMMADTGVFWTPTLAVMEALANADRPTEYLAEAYPGLPDRFRPSDRALAIAASDRASRRAAVAGRILRAVLDGPIARAMTAGMRLAAGTDAGNNYTPHGWALHRELHLLRRAGLDTDQVLTAATGVAAAKLTGPDPDFGRVAVGVHADLLVLAEDPRRSTDALTRPELVIAAGRPSSR